MSSGMHTGRDPADCLPAPARKRYEAMRQQRGDLHALVRVVGEQSDKLRLQREKLWVRVRELEDMDRRGQLTKEAHIYEGSSGRPRVKVERDPRQLDAAREDLARLEARMGEAEARRAARAAPFNALGQLLTRVDDWLLDHASPGSQLPLHTGGATKPAKPGNIAAAIEQSRKRLAKARADLAEVKAAPVPSTQAKEAARSFAKAIAEKGRPDVYRVIEGGASISFPNDRHIVNVNSGLPGGGSASGGGAAILPDPVAIAAWLDPQAFTARLEAEIDAAADDARALDDETRATRTAELQAAILETEREECALMELAAAEGVDAIWRNDVDPRAVLGLASELPGLREV
jgi:hypothetical protein